MSGEDIAAMLQGAVVTVSLSLAGILIGLPIGLGLALIRWANIPVLAQFVTVYVSVLRATPLVTLLLLLFFSLPNVVMPINPISAASLGLVMITSAFNCEVWRAALTGFPRDQYEAAQSVGLRAGQRFRRRRQPGHAGVAVCRRALAAHEQACAGRPHPGLGGREAGEALKRRGNAGVR